MTKEKNFEKLYNSLVPFLLEADLFDKLQESVYGKTTTDYKVKLQMAIYLIDKEFFHKDYDANFAAYVEREKHLKHKN